MDLLRHLRWDELVANDILVTLDALQLRSGFTTPLLEDTSPNTDYVGASLLIALRSRLNEIDASIWIEKAWAPCLQRDGDGSLMEAFCGIPGIALGQLIRVNEVRIYCRVVTIADLANPNGTHICDGMVDGSWQAGSDLYWLEIPCPPKEDWALFRKCLRTTFCTRSPIYQRKHYSMPLDKKLGSWLPVERHTWFHCYRSPDAIFWRNDEGSLHCM